MTQTSQTLQNTFIGSGMRNSNGHISFPQKPGLHSLHICIFFHNATDSDFQEFVHRVMGHHNTSPCAEKYDPLCIFNCSGCLLNFFHI